MVSGRILKDGLYDLDYVFLLPETSGQTESRLLCCRNAALELCTQQDLAEHKHNTLFAVVICLLEIHICISRSYLDLNKIIDM